MDLADLLRQHQRDLIQIWGARVLADPAVPEANRQPAPALLDHVPELIARVIRLLDRDAGEVRDMERVGRSAGQGDESQAHADDRLAARYALPSALKELSHLRAAVFELCARERAAIPNQQLLLLNAQLDEAMVMAAVRLHEAAQAELRAGQAALARVSQERDATLATLETFMASAPVGFAVVDRDLRYVRINETLARMNGAPAAAHLGKRVPDVIPRYAEQAEALLRRVLETGQSVVGLHVAVADGDRDRHLLASYYPLHAADGQVTSVGAVVIDITDQKRAEQELLKDVELRERFMAILGHDLRSPLAAILLSAQALLRNEGVPPGYIRGLQRIKSSARRAERLVRDLVDLVRSRQGAGIPLRPEPLDLKNVCEDVIAEVNAAYEDRKIELVARGSCNGRWDPDRVAQLAANLLTNAVTYSPPETPVTVQVDGRPAQAVFLRVHNQGPAIAPELLPSLFDPFRRGSGDALEQAQHGLGLGLHIARQIALAHGGRIDVESTAEAGTTFTVVLPREPVTSAR